MELHYAIKLTRLLLLSCRFLGCGLLGGLLGSRLLGSLLSSRLLDGLLCLGFLDSGLLDDLLRLGFLDNSLLGQLVRSSSLASGLSHLQTASSNSPLQSHTQVNSSLGSINLVVGTDVLEDGLARRASPVLQGRDGCGDHLSILGVSSRCLGLGGLLHLNRGSSSSVRHDDRDCPC